MVMNDLITRAGSRTSEFWLALAFFGAVIINGTHYVDIPGTEMAMLFSAAFGYAGGRTLLKNTAAKKA